MRVTITNNEIARGIFKKTTLYSVGISIIFSEEEKAIIKQRGLQSYQVYPNVIIEGAMKGDKHYVDVRLLLKQNCGRLFHTSLEAKAFERELTEKLLPNLKTIIMGNANYESKTKTFEL